MTGSAEHPPYRDVLSLSSTLIVSAHVVRRRPEVIVKAQLRKKLLEELALRGAPASTRETYMGCIDELRLPDDLGRDPLAFSQLRAALSAKSWGGEAPSSG